MLRPNIHQFLSDNPWVQMCSLPCF